MLQVAPRANGQPHTVTMAPENLHAYLCALGSGWYAAFKYRHRPPQQPSQGRPQPQRPDAELRLREGRDSVCYVSHDGANSGWHGHWYHAVDPDTSNPVCLTLHQQLKVTFRYNSEFPYEHTFTHGDGYVAYDSGKRQHTTWWFGTKFEGWPRTHRDRHEIWLLEPAMFRYEPSMDW